MSAISSVGSSLRQYFQGIQAGASPTAASDAAAVSGTADQDQQGASGAVQGAHHHHHGGHGGGGGFAKIQQAVTSALQAAQSDGSSSDPNQAIQDAITQVFQQQLGADGSSSAATSATTTGVDTDGDQDGSPSASGTNNPARQAFAQTLQSYGVSEQQFRADFAAALQAAQNGQSDATSTAFQSFPPGSLVDTAA